MDFKKLKLPIIIIAIGVAACIAVSFFTTALFKPTVTEHDFPCSVTYRLNGETKTIEDIYHCTFEGFGFPDGPTDRYFDGVHVSNADNDHDSSYVIDKKGEYELHIVYMFNPYYLMGEEVRDVEREGYGVPYLAVYDDNGVGYPEPEFLELFDAKILSWESPEPIENSFVFGGFTLIYDVSMICMMLIGYLAMIACMIAVKRDADLKYQGLDYVSIVFNYILAIVGIPFILIITWFSQIFMSEDSIFYLLDLCVPAFTAFTLAASISLRRKGYTIGGFVIQLIGPAFYFGSAALSSIIG